MRRDATTMQAATDAPTNVLELLTLLSQGSEEIVVLGDHLLRDVIEHFRSYLRGVSYVHSDRTLDPETAYRLFFPPAAAREAMRFVSDYLVAHPFDFQGSCRHVPVLAVCIDMLHRTGRLDDILLCSYQAANSYVQSLYRAVASNAVVSWRLAADLHALFAIDLADIGERDEKNYVHNLYGLLGADVEGEDGPSERQVDVWFDELIRHASAELDAEVRSILTRSSDITDLYFVHHYPEHLSFVEEERAKWELQSIANRLERRGLPALQVACTQLSQDELTLQADRVARIPLRLRHLFAALGRVLLRPQS